LKRKRSDPHREWLKSTYRDMVGYVVRVNPGLNVNQITEQVTAIRPKWKELTAGYGEQKGWEFPKGEPERKTVSRHLRELIEAGDVVGVGGLFIPLHKHLEEQAGRLDRLVHKVLSSRRYEPWNIPYAAAAAGCYILSQPAWSHEKFEGLFHIQLERFKNELFWFDDILRFAISDAKLSPRVYSKNQINIDLLKQGWERCFDDTQLFVFAVAVSPPRLLEFLTTQPGRVLAEQRLQQSWKHIVEHAEGDVERFHLEKLSGEGEK